MIQMKKFQCLRFIMINQLFKKIKILNFHRLTALKSLSQNKEWILMK